MNNDGVKVEIIDTGLGLSIAKTILDMHGAKTKTLKADSDWCKIRLGFKILTLVVHGGTTNE